MAYLKKVSDAKTDSGVGNGWFKVSDNNSWGVLADIADKIRSLKTPLTARSGVSTA